MIVPTNISPIDYLERSNEFIFVTAQFILRVNYESRHFELETPNETSYHNSFEYIEAPSEEFETLDFGLIKWIKLAINWDKSKALPNNNLKLFSFEVEGITYKVKFNARTHDIILKIKGKTIFCKRDLLTDEFPELQYIEFGRLITEITTLVVNKMLKQKKETKELSASNLPLELNLETIQIEDNTYKFDYLADFDLVLLSIPTREIQANLLLIETDAPELAELHQGMLYDMIRSVVYEKSPSN